MNLAEQFTNLFSKKDEPHKETLRVVTGNYIKEKKEEYVPSKVTQRDVARPFRRVSPRELKYAAYTDPICFNTLNKTTQLILLLY